MLKFINVDQRYPDKRSPEERKTDFAEIYAPFSEERGAEQAERCSQCGVPFCQSGCPLHNDIPDWLMLAAEGRMEEAYERSSATSTMPEVCGRICPQDRLCEGNCVIEQSGHGCRGQDGLRRHVGARETLELAGLDVDRADDDPDAARDAIRGHVAYYVGSGEGYERAVATRFPDEAVEIAAHWRGDGRDRQPFVEPPEQRTRGSRRGDGSGEGLHVAGAPISTRRW